MGTLLIGNSLLLVLFNLLLIISFHDSFIVHAAAESKLHIVYLGGREHNDPELITRLHHDMLLPVVGSKEAAADSMVYSYKHGFSGFAAKLTETQAQRVADLPGVVSVIPNQFHSLQTTRSWDYLDLSSSYSHSPSNLLHDANMGDGVIIGVLDSGIWPESKVFNDDGLGPIPTRWKGHCESGQLFNGSINCNKKLIGAKYFIDGFLAENKAPFNTTENPDYLSPRDVNGHGTLVSSIAAGSFVANATYKGLASGTVRGGAPHARIAMYKAFWNVPFPAGQASSADVLQAFDEAIKDGVDVLSLSFGNQIPLYSEVDVHDVVSIGTFHAVARGIHVVSAAGNEGPTQQTVTNVAPWILTVAASSIDRSFPTPITLGNNITILGQGKFVGKELGFTGLVFPEAPAPIPYILPGLCESLSFNSTSADGKVVLCFAKESTTIEETVATSVRAAGGVGVIIARNRGIVPVNSCSNDFPCIVVDNELGTRILFNIRSTRSPIVKISPSRTLVGKSVSTKIAHFSSRGPSSVSPAILKPDIAAPGVNILAAISPSNPLADGGLALLSGTSVATPGVSGIVALLKALHPNWSPAAMKSAIVTTAWKTDPFGEPIFSEGVPRKLADPFDYGGGLINANKAAKPGLVYDMGIDDYIHYLCAAGYSDSSISYLVGKATTCPETKPSILDVNVPSITIPNLKNSATLTRTVTNVGPRNSMYRAFIEQPIGILVAVNPDILVFNSSTQTNSFRVTISTNHKVNSGYYFGSLTWTDGKHNVTTPISVRTQIIESYVDEY